MRSCDHYKLDGKKAVITGAGGAICGEIASALAREGAAIAIWDISREAGAKKRDEIIAAGGKAIAAECNAMDKESVKAALCRTLDEFGTVDILVNGAGGSRRETSTSPELSFFDLEPEAMTSVISLNYMTSVVPSQAVGKVFAEKGRGVILNITSIAGLRPLTKTVSYSNGKAAANSFTQWLAVHMAQNYSPEIRVNAIAPGFILTDQNRFLLVDKETGGMTERGKQILNHVPMGRYGKPEEIVGAALWLVSEMAGFVTGSVVIIDGGFTAFSGV